MDALNSGDISFNSVAMKRQALQEHLLKEKQRKTEYQVVRGVINNKQKNKIDSTVKLKSIGRDFERFAKASISSNSDDMGNQSVVATYNGAKVMAVGGTKLNAISKSVVKGTVKVTNGTINIAGKTYNVASNIYAGYLTGTLSGTLNMYKNMAFNGVSNTIKYSKPVYHIRNTIDGTKTIYLQASYNFAKIHNFVKGVGSGAVKITTQGVLDFAYKFAYNGTKTAYKMAWEGTKATASGIKSTAQAVDRFSKRRVVRGSLRGVESVTRSLSNNSDDEGTQAISTSVDTAKYSFKALKSTGVATVKAGATVGEGAYKTARGTYRFYKDAKSQGIKRASKIWYDAHLKGAGKRLTEKIEALFVKSLKSFLSKPLVLGILLLLCVTVVSNTAVITASSTVGGVVNFFEELAEGLIDAIENVVEKIKDFLEDCVDWVKNLFGINDEGEVEVKVDVDIGDSMSICDYLLGTVQVYKAELGVELDERCNELYEEGYHDIIFYNYNGDTIEISDMYDENKGLMADKEYVKAELPVWKAIIFGTIGTDFTGSEANSIAKKCFNALTKIEEEPYVDINNDGVGDYNYCDGFTSVDEADHLCVIKIGDVWQSGLEMAETYTCYNASGNLIHTSHNTQGIACCTTSYWCGGHISFACNGHTTYCWSSYKDSYDSCTDYLTITAKCNDINTCTNPTDTDEVRYCNEYDVVNCTNSTDTTTYHNSYVASIDKECDNYTTVTVPGQTLYVCNGHTGKVCNGHTGKVCNGHTQYVCNGHTTYCWSGYKDSYDSCTNFMTNLYSCYDGRLNTSQGCSNERTEFECKGYTLCYGHRLMKFYLGSSGFDKLIENQFLDRIEELEAKDSLTDEEITELSQLQMYYDFALNCWENSDPILDEWYAEQP